MGLIKTGRKNDHVAGLARRVADLDQKMNAVLKAAEELESVIGKDRRRHRRQYMLAAMEVSVPGGLPMEAYSVNVSAGGICLYSRIYPPRDTRLMIRIFYCNDDQRDRPSETFWGTVVWCRQVGPIYGVGIQFENIDPRQHPILLSLLERSEAIE